MNELIEGWIIIGEYGQMDCHVLSKTKQDVERALAEPHPDTTRRIVHLREVED